MKRAVLLRLSALLLPLFLAAACGDLPTATSAPDLAGAGPMLSGECIPNDDGLYICPPISGGGGGECDEYHYDCGGDDCISSSGPGALDAATVQGCTGGGGGGGTIGDGGGTGGGGGGSGGGTGTAPPCPDFGCTSTAPEYAPNGIDQAYYEGLNDKERRLCWANPAECWNVKSAADHALAWAAAQEPNGAHNGPQDAMRHAMWNARMTQLLGWERAKVWADAHESSSTAPDETRMDLFNNAAGRDIGRTFNDIAAGVWHYRNTGQLCLFVGRC
jgi:hypothetical protein